MSYKRCGNFDIFCSRLRNPRKKIFIYAQSPISDWCVYWAKCKISEGCAILHNFFLAQNTLNPKLLFQVTFCLPHVSRHNKFLLDVRCIFPAVVVSCPLHDHCAGWGVNSEMQALVTVDVTEAEVERCMSLHAAQRQIGTWFSLVWGISTWIQLFLSIPRK